MSTRNIEYSAPVSRDTEPKRNVSQLSLNHPKNYLGVPLAVAADGDTGHIINTHLVSMCGRARDGAEALGLITCDADLTPLGRHVVATCEEDASVEEILTLFRGLKGSSARFCETSPDPLPGALAAVVSEYDPATQVIDVLQKTGPVTLAELGGILLEHDHAFAEQLFRDASSVGNEVSVTDPEAYAGQAVYQFKTLLFHSGVLTHRGADTSAIIPAQDIWALEPAYDAGETGGDL